MDLTELEKALDLVEKACLRAFMVLTGPPYQKCIDNEDESYLYLDGEEAVLVVPIVLSEDDGSGYPGGYLSHEVFRFPASLLALSDDEFEKWRNKEKIQYESTQRRERRLREEAAARKKEIEELHTLRLLKAKYEP